MNPKLRASKTLVKRAMVNMYTKKEQPKYTSTKVVLNTPIKKNQPWCIEKKAHIRIKKMRHRCLWKEKKMEKGESLPWIYIARCFIWLKRRRTQKKKEDHRRKWVRMWRKRAAKKRFSRCWMRPLKEDHILINQNLLFRLHQGHCCKASRRPINQNLRFNSYQARYHKVGPNSLVNIMKRPWCILYR